MKTGVICNPTKIKKGGKRKEKNQPGEFDIIKGGKGSVRQR